MTLEQRKALVRGFLRRCNDYADDMLRDYRRRLETASGAEALELADRIAHWTAYRHFNEHAIDELGTERLDTWLEDGGE